ncbi:MAG: rhomboid family intramembrane serine protease [Ruthenibacterium sp.]
MKWLYKLENKYGRFCIPNLMLVIVIGQGMVFLANLFAPAAGIIGRLALIWPFVLQGQIWRLITFVFVPSDSSVLFLLISLYFYYFIGHTLENTWGAFKFNVYYLLGVLGAIVAAVLAGAATTTYLNLSLFFAFAMLYPDMQVLLFFVFPIKMKYLAYVSAGLTLLSVLTGSWMDRACILMALVNFFIFFGGDFTTRVKQEIRYGKTRRAWKSQNRNQNGSNRGGW